MTHRILKDQKPYGPPCDTIHPPHFSFWHSTFGTIIGILSTLDHALSCYTSVYPEVNAVILFPQYVVEKRCYIKAAVC